MPRTTSSAAKLTISGPRANIAWLATELQKARKNAGFSTRKEAIEQIRDWSTSKLIRIEDAKVSISPTDLKFLIKVYGIKEPLAEEMLKVARMTYMRRTNTH